MTSRRTNEVSGYVNFPIDNSEYQNSGEGGMFVRLVVMDSEAFQWMKCCGGYQFTSMDESYLGDDLRPQPATDWEDEPTTKEESLRKFKAYRKAQQEYEEYHFPDMNVEDKDLSYGQKYHSYPYLCAMTIGSTGWSGYHQEKGYFRCTYDDLTDEGKQLYNLIKKFYSSCEVYLQTWLDT